MPTDPQVHPGLTEGVPSLYADSGLGSDSVLDAFAQPFAQPGPVDPRALSGHHVTAVLVAHNGARWLPRSLEALAASDRAPERVVAVDTGSRDETAAQLAQALGAPAIVTMKKKTGFGDAVKGGLEYIDRQRPVSGNRPDRVEWIWLIHDDCAPAPDALRHLLEGAVRNPDAAVIGPKVCGWRGDRQLLEIGLTITGGGRRHTGLEKREYDQGQHDVPRDVLAAGSAGLLIRRDVWEQLDGFDRNIALFRDDIDFGWRANLAGHAVIVCPDAVVYHAEAAAHGRRRLGATRDRPHLVDRRNALYVVLANVPATRLPLTLLRVLVGCLGRAAGFLLGKQPALAAEEMLAVLAVLGRPDRLLAARFRRRRTRRVEQDSLGRLFLPVSQQLRHAGETVLALVTGSGSGSGHDLPSSTRRAENPSGSNEDDEPLESDSALVRFITQPVVILVGCLLLVTLVAARGLIGAGRLTGGAMLPAPGDAGVLWSTYTETWHGVGLGSPTASPPYLAVLAALSSVFHSPSFVVDLLLIGSVPLAGLTSYLLIRKVVESRWLRIWGAAVYAMLPATTGAIAAGRIGTTTATVLTPLVVLAIARTLGRPDRPGPARVAWSAGLLLAVTAAFVPLAWIVAVALAVATMVTGYRTRAAALRWAVIVGITPIVFVPWTFEVLGDPSLALAEAGAPGPGLSDPELAPWSVLLQNPGGPGSAPVWLGAGVLAAGWVALFVRANRRPILAAWAVVGVALTLGLLVSRRPVTGPTLETPVSGWPGYAAVLVGGGLVLAALAAARGGKGRLASASFGWRQPMSVLLVVAAGLTPLAAAGWWVTRGADDPVDRRDPEVLPAYVVDESMLPDRVRTLVLGSSGDGGVTYALLRRGGPRLGDAETGPTPEHYRVLDAVVADLVSGRGGADATRLADFGARYVYLPAPADPGLTDVLDTVPGLIRSSAPEGAAIWQVDATVARARVLGGNEGAVKVPSEDVTAGGTIPPGPDGRQLVLAERTDPGWTATLAGKPLEPVTYDDWAQAFALPENGGEVEITHQGARRRDWLLVQLAVVLAAIVLTLPSMRRDRGAVEGVADVEPDEVPVAATPPLPVPVGVGAASRPPLPARRRPSGVPRRERRKLAEPVGDPSPAEVRQVPEDTAPPQTQPIPYGAERVAYDTDPVRYDTDPVRSDTHPIAVEPGAAATDTPPDAPPAEAADRKRARRGGRRARHAGNPRPEEPSRQSEPTTRGRRRRGDDR